MRSVHHISPIFIIVLAELMWSTPNFQIFDFQSSFIVQDRLVVVPLRIVDVAEVVDRVCRVDVVYSEFPIVDRQSSFIIEDRLIVLTLKIVDVAEVVYHGVRVDVVHSEFPIIDLQSSFVV